MANRLLNFWFNLSKQRRKRVVLFISGIVLVCVVLWAARSVLGPYLIGLMLAYMLAPVVDFIQKGLTGLAERIRFGFLRKRARGLSIFITYLLLVASVVGFFALVVPVIAREAQAIWEGRENIWEDITGAVDNLLAQYELLPPQIKEQAQESLNRLTTSITNVLQQVLQGTVVAITYTANVVLGIAIIPFWVFYLLRDIDLLGRTVRNMIPSSAWPDVSNVARLVDKTLGAYLRGQILLCLIIGVMTTVVMSLLGVEYALLLGVLAGTLEVIPNIGPTVAAIPAILLALTDSLPKAAVTAVAANLIQQVENSVIVPRVLGESVGLHPVLLMVMLVVGAELGGLPGLFLAPILTAVFRDLYQYANYRFADEPLPPETALTRVCEGGEFFVEV